MSTEPESTVEVYRNLHRKCWSVRGRRSGRVQAHENAVVLLDAEFRVSEAGRQRVLRERKKNVHATVRGELLADGHHRYQAAAETGMLRRARYNPYEGGTFTDAETGEPVTRAAVVVLTAQGSLFYRLDKRKRKV